MTALYATLAEILEVDQVGANDPLRDFDNWDSLTILSIVATLDADYGVTLTSADIRSVTTAGQLASLVEERRR